MRRGFTPARIATGYAVLFAIAYVAGLVTRYTDDSADGLEFLYALLLGLPWSLGVLPAAALLGSMGAVVVLPLAGAANAYVLYRLSGSRPKDDRAKSRRG